KRWQDIDELLAAGIDVWTTLNIQHLESLNDVIQKITKVRVRETVPDTVFDKADEIVLVDFPPDELLKRLAQGKIYVQDTAARARIDEAMKLAESLGAETQTLTGSDLPAELLRFAKFENVTQIVVGRSQGGFFGELLRRSLPHELMRRSPGIAVHVVTRETDAAPARRARARPAWLVEPLAFGYATLAVGAALGFGKMLTR